MNFYEVLFALKKGAKGFVNHYETLFANALNGDSPTPTLSSITAVFNQGTATIYDTDTLDSLKQYLTVTATYSDSTTETVTTYTLSGTLVVGTSTITVSYGGKTDTFTVMVSDVGHLYHLENKVMTADDTVIIPVSEINILNPDQDFTVGCDVTVTSKNGDWKIMRNYETSSPWNGIFIGVGQGYFRTKYYDQVVNMSAPSTVTRARVVMTHVAGSNKMTTYYRINDAGTTSSGVATKGYSALTMGNMVLGKHNTNTWAGTIHKFDIYGFAFTQAEAESYITGE